MAAVVGPFVLLVVGGADPNNPNHPTLPWHFMATGLVLALAIVGVGFFMFTRESKRESEYEEEISISPEHHRPTERSRAVSGTR